jgi:mRNA interferase MazF
LKPGDVVIAVFPGANLTKARPAVVVSNTDYQRDRPDVILGLITTNQSNPLCPTDCELLD